MTDHSIIAPSSAGVWGKPGGCPGSVTMQLMYPETEESESSRQGTAAHEVGELLIRAYPLKVDRPSREDVIGIEAENGEFFDDDMYDGAELYADHVIEIYKQFEGGLVTHFQTEMRVEAPRVHELSFGSVDAHLWSRPAMALHIWDYKFGHEAVEEYENWQMINYAAGLFDHYGIDGNDDQNVTVYFHIVQPRAFHRDGPIRTHTMVGSSLRGYVNILAKNATEAMQTDATTTSGRHCRHCTARLNCPTAMRGAISLFEASDEVTPIDLTPDQMGVQLQIIRSAQERLKSLESALKTQVESSIKSGNLVPGWEAVPKYGRLAWNADVDTGVIATLSAEHDVNLFKDVEPLTPTQSITLLKRSGVDTAVIKQYSSRPNSGLEIVPADKNKAKKVFSK